MGAKNAPLPYTLLTDLEIESMPIPEQLVDGIVTKNAFVVLFGSSGIGKTFATLSMAYCVATGSPWLGRDVLHGAVVYVAAEGVAGLGARVRAWKAEHDVQGEVDVHFLPEALNLADPSDVERLLLAINKLTNRPLLVIVDTLARTIGDTDENSATEMGVVIRHVDRLRQEANVAVLLVHHTAKKKGAKERGSGALRGAADCMIGIEAKGPLMQIVSEKSKELPRFSPINARLKPVGDSCVIESLDAAGTKASQENTPVNQAIALKTLFELGGGPVSNKEWGGATKIKERTFQDVRGTLVERGLVRQEGAGKSTRYSLSETGQAWITANCNITANTLQATNGPSLHAISSPVGGDCSSTAASEEGTP